MRGRWMKTHCFEWLSHEAFVEAKRIGYEHLRHPFNSTAACCGRARCSRNRSASSRIRFRMISEKVTGGRWTG